MKPTIEECALWLNSETSSEDLETLFFRYPFKDLETAVLAYLRRLPVVEAMMSEIKNILGSDMNGTRTLYAVEDVVAAWDAEREKENAS